MARGVNRHGIGKHRRGRDALRGLVSGINKSNKKEKKRAAASGMDGEARGGSNVGARGRHDAPGVGNRGTKEGRYSVKTAMYYDEGERGAAYGGKGVLAYRTKEVKAGEYLDVEMYPVLERQWERTGEGRTKSPEAIRRVNLRNARKRLSRLLNANFGIGDIITTLTDRTAQTEEEAKKHLNNYIAALRRLAKKYKQELTYLYVMETTSTGVFHIHMAIRNFAGTAQEGIEKARAKWKHGITRMDPVQETGNGLKGFALYITQKKSTQEKILRRRWAGSQNLRRPTEKITDRRFSRRAADKVARAAREDARALIEKKYPGYQLVEEPEIYYSDVLPGAYIYLSLRRIRAGNEARRR